MELVTIVSHAQKHDATHCLEERLENKEHKHSEILRVLEKVVYYPTVADNQLKIWKRNTHIS